jgi:hypothetical protein
MQPLSFRRIYRDASGPEYPATPEVVRIVLASMNSHAKGSDPFKVEFRLEDGSTVTVKPKGAA